MSYNHNHAENGRNHAPASFGRAYAIGSALNIGYVAVEAEGLLSAEAAVLTGSRERQLCPSFSSIGEARVTRNLTVCGTVYVT